MSDEIRVLHTSDVHLDAGFRASGVSSARARERCRAHLDAFDRFVETARAHEVHVVLIAGDLFEAAHARPSTGRHVAKRLAALERPVFIAPGNHDPFQERSLYDLVEWPANVHIFKGGWSHVALPELHTVVHGRGFTAPEEDARLLDGLDVEAAGPGLHLAVAHGSNVAARPDRHHPYRPFTPDEFDAHALAYVALGHYHSFSILPSAHTTVAYSGSPIPQGFNETGDHGVVLAHVSAAGARVELLPLPARRFVTLDVDVSGVDTQTELVEKLASELEDYAHDFVRLQVRGSLPPDLEVEPAVLREELKTNVHDLDVRESTVPEYDLEAIAAEGTVRGLFVKGLVERLDATSGDDAIVVKRAIHFGLDAFSGRPQTR